MSLGEDRVRIKFNPSSDSLVDQIKTKAAEFIDLCAMNMDANRDKQGYGEVARLWSLAMTHAEDAAMWAVKAATAGKP